MTLLSRSRLLRVLLAAAAASAGAAVQAQPAWPAKPITIIVPFAAGGGTDVVTRAVAQLMGRQLNASFVVENRPGANSFIGAQAASRAAPDGRTFFMTSLTTHSINPYLFKSLPYSVSDFVPVGFLVGTSPVLFTSAANPVPDVRAVVAQGQARADGLNFAVPNASSRFATLMFGVRSGVKVTEVNFNATPQAHTEVSTGRVDYIFGDFTAGGGLYEGRRLKALAIAGPRRLGSHPEIPTMAEAGVTGVEVEIWAGLFAPRGTPQDTIQKVNAALNRALQDAGVQDILRKGSQDARPMSPEQFGAYVEAQYQHWGAMARALKIQPE
ncbi:MAG TPA: tripartite tricarboxylate transporter substrate binding protein [Ramlibacter sp.]|nr:tripartite tricarboxylate transporter substrate binding protein [Ramlibacter sp.]